MKVFKQFMIKGMPEVLDDSYVSAATDGAVAGLSLHDGKESVSFNFDLTSENGQKAAMQTLLTIEKAIEFLRKEGKVAAGPKASGLAKVLGFLDKLTAPRR